MAGKFSNPRGSAPAPAVQSSSTPTPSEPRKGPRTGTLIFYTAYVMLIVFFIVGMRIHLKDLDRKLVEFEHAQPHTQSQLVFEELFTDPDWALLYDLAQIPDTRFDGREEYAQYMKPPMAVRPSPTVKPIPVCGISAHMTLSAVTATSALSR